MDSFADRDRIILAGLAFYYWITMPGMDTRITIYFFLSKQQE